MPKIIEEIKITEQHIEAWFTKFFHNSIISRDEKNIDIALSAKQELKQMLFPSPAVNPAAVETTTNKE